MVTLAVGLGSAVAMYTVVDQVLLRPLPYRDPGALIQITEVDKNGELGWGDAYLDIPEWQARSQALESIAFVDWKGSLDTSIFSRGRMDRSKSRMRRSAETYYDAWVSPGDGTRLPGRGNGGAATAGCPYDYAERCDMAGCVRGRPADSRPDMRVRGEAYTVIGVMPRTSSFPLARSPDDLETDHLRQRGQVTRQNVTPSYQAIARLAPVANVSSANAELKGIQRGVAAKYTDPDSREDVRSVCIGDMAIPWSPIACGSPCWLLGASSAVLWLIACVNVTSLLLARAPARQREIAVRGALGQPMADRAATAD